MPDGRFRCTSVKVMQDGVVESRTAGLTTPYLDDDGAPGTERGLSYVEPSVLQQVAVACARAGFRLHVHAIGDRAVREALDALAAAQADPASQPDLRHHVAHLQVVDPADVPRFARLGVTANLQALWACHETVMDEPEHPAARSHPQRLAVPLRRPRAQRRRAWPWARTGRSPRPIRWRRSRWPSRGRRHPVRDRCSPARRSTSRRPCGRTCAGRRGSTTRTTRVASSKAFRPTWSCSTATPSRCRPTSSPPCAATSRWSTAERCGSAREPAAAAARPLRARPARARRRGLRLHRLGHLVGGDPRRVGAGLVRVPAAAAGADRRAARRHLDRACSATGSPRPSSWRPPRTTGSCTRRARSRRRPRPGQRVR
nr:amidohydrolase family protein [Angustibacter aerolatus]